MIKLFIKLYGDRKGNPFDHRNYGHGFIGSIIWAIIFLLYGQIVNFGETPYWWLIAIPVATILTFVIAFVFEKIQSRNKQTHRFNWNDVFATNIWFLPLWFIVTILLALTKREKK